MHRKKVAAELELCLQKSLQAPRLRVVSLSGQRPEIDEQREPWIPIKYGPRSTDEWYGIVPATARFELNPSAGVDELNLVIKVNPRQALSETLIPWIIEQRKIALDRTFVKYVCAAEFQRTGAREQHIYTLGESISALRRVLPRCYGIASDAVTGEHCVFLEHVTGIVRLDASGAAASWPADAIDVALNCAAHWQAAFWNAPAAAWAGPRATTEDMVADAPLWKGLLDDAKQRFPDIITENVWRRRCGIIERLAEWHATKDRLPTTLAHNDFNQRNVGFRPAVLVLDWELAQFNTAHRDLVELLTFVLPPSTDRKQVDAHVEKHRQALIACGVSLGVDRDAWIEGFRCELKVEAINRISYQFLFAAQFPLAYLGRINSNIEHLLDMYE